MFLTVSYKDKARLFADTEQPGSIGCGELDNLKRYQDPSERPHCLRVSIDDL